MRQEEERAWQNLTDRMQEIGLLHGAQALLAWDQQTYMPPGGAAMRGAQNATLASLNHDRFTAPEVGEWLNILGEAKLDAFHQASLRNLKRQRDREVRIPKELVLASAKASTDGFTRWMAAREAEDFSLFAPALETLVELSKAKIACLKKDEACGYDILLEQLIPESPRPGLIPSSIAWPRESTISWTKSATKRHLPNLKALGALRDNVRCLRTLWLLSDST